MDPWEELKAKMKRSQHALSKLAKENSGHNETLIRQKTKQLVELQGAEELLDMEIVNSL